MSCCGGPFVPSSFTGGGGGGGSGGVDVEDEGVPLVDNPHDILNFVGAGVTAVDAGGGRATITIPGGISGLALQEEGVPLAGAPFSTLNFIGGGVTATNAGAGVGAITVPAPSIALGLQAFRYTVTGAEPSLSDFFVPLPVVRANDTYRVQATLAGVAVIVGVNCPDLVAADRTTVQFRFVSTAAMTAGDQIDFLVTDVV